MKRSIIVSLLALLTLVIAIGFFANQVQAQNTAAKKPVKEKVSKEENTGGMMGCGVFEIHAISDTSREICITDSTGEIYIWSNAEKSIIWNCPTGGTIKTTDWSGEFAKFDAKVSVEFPATDEKLPLGMLSLLNGKKCLFALSMR